MDMSWNFGGVTTIKFAIESIIETCIDRNVCPCHETFVEQIVEQMSVILRALFYVIVRSLSQFVFKLLLERGLNTLMVFIGNLKAASLFLVSGSQAISHGKVFLGEEKENNLLCLSLIRDYQLAQCGALHIF